MSLARQPRFDADDDDDSGPDPLLRRVGRTALGTALITAGIAGVYMAPLGVITIASAFATSSGALVMCRAIVAPSIYRSPVRRKRGSKRR